MSVFKTARNTIKTNLNIAISNGMGFSVQIVPLENKSYEYPDAEAVSENMTTFVKDEMRFKPLNPRALEGMKKKWVATNGPDVPFVAKKQMSEIIVVLIAPSEEAIHLFYSIPKTTEFTVPDDHYDKRWDLDNRVVYYGEMLPPKSGTLFKYKDQLAADILDQLKLQGIYIDEEDDDEMYCLNDLDEE